MNTRGYPQMTRSEVVAHCRYWVGQIRHDGIDLLVKDYGAAVGVSDQLAYPLDMQKWIEPERDPLLYAIRTYAARADSHHQVRDNWKKLLVLIDALGTADEKEYDGSTSE